MCVLCLEMHIYTHLKESLYMHIYIHQAIGLMSRVFANGLEDQGSIPGRVIPKTQKMVLDATQHYKVRIKDKVEQSRERSSTLPYTSV